MTKPLLTSFATILVALLCAAPASAAGWQQIGLTHYPTVTDGAQMIAFQPDDHHVTVIDTRTGGAGTTYDIPGCGGSGSAYIQGVGGGQLLLDCYQPQTGTTPQLLTLATGTWHAPLPPPVPAGRSVAYELVGAHWIERRSWDSSSEGVDWFDWQTGEVRTADGGVQRVPDLDSPDLWVTPCPGVHPAAIPFVYGKPYAVVDGHDGLRLQQCGSARSLPIEPRALDTLGMRLSGGLVTWESQIEKRPTAGAYLIACHVGLEWHYDSGITLVHVGRTLLRNFPPDKYDAPSVVERLQLPSGCPGSAVGKPLPVRLPGGHRTQVRPYSASWRASNTWGAGHAQVPAGTFAAKRIALAPSAAIRVHAPSATGVRWKADAGQWHTVHRVHGRWTVVLPKHGVPHTLQLALRYPNGGQATYQMEVMRKRGR